MSCRSLYLEDINRDALDVQRGQQDRVHYLSYAFFQDHDFTETSRWSSRTSWTQSVSSATFCFLIRVQRSAEGRALRITTVSSCGESWQKDLRMVLCLCMVFCYSRSGFSATPRKIGSGAKIAGRFSDKGGHGSHYNPPAARQQDIR